MDGQAVGRILIATGAIAIALGVVSYFGVGRMFSFMGRLPGDIRIEGENTKVFIPITTSIVISAVLTLLLLILSRFR
jgi:hypothetical protein